MESGSEQVLTYAPRSRPRWLKPRYLIMAVLLIAGSWIYFKYAEEISLRIRRRYWGEQCMQYVVPPNTPALEIDSTFAANRVARNAEFVMTRYATGSAAVFYPKCWREFERIDAKLAIRRSFSSPQPIAFLHERISRGRTRRLVVITESYAMLEDLPDAIFRAAIVPPSLFERWPPPAIDFQGQLREGSTFGPRTPVRLVGGSADVNDRSHFSIGYDVLKVSASRSATAPATITATVVAQGKIDGYLQDDGRIDLYVRKPTTVPSTQTTSGPIG